MNNYQLNQLHKTSNRIKKRYLHQKSGGILKKAKKKAADWFRKARFLGTDDLETIDYNNDTNVNDFDDVETITYNNDTNINNLDNVNLKKTSGAQIAAKKLIQKYRNLARIKTYQTGPQNNFDDLTDLETIDYNKDTSISDLNNITSGSKKISGTQIATKTIIKKYRNLAKKKAQINENDLEDAKTVDYNSDTNISGLNEPPSKQSLSAQIAAKKF